MSLHPRFHRIPIAPEWLEMITIRRDNERFRARHGIRQVWQTFFSRPGADPLAGGFGVLETFTEARVPPGASVPRALRRDSEILTYVCNGAMANEDFAGRSGILQAGDFHRRSVGRGSRHRERNASRSDWLHIFQASLRPAEAELAPCEEQRLYPAAQRKGRLCVIASPDGRRGSLHIHQDVRIFTAMLEPGHHVVHELLPSRSAWLHVVLGKLTMEGFILSRGDGVGVSDQPAVSFTACEQSEILLFDLAEDSGALAVKCAG
jgi:hypothetical protein